MKKIFVFIAATFFLLNRTTAQNLYSGEGVNWVGQINGYSQPSNLATDYRVLKYRKVSTTAGNPADGRGQWVTTINVQASGGNVTPLNMSGGGGNGFLFTSGPSGNQYANKFNFSGIGTGTIDAVNGVQYSTGGGQDMGLNMSTAGYYTFVLKDAGYTATGFYAGFTSAAPVTFTHLQNSQLIFPGNGEAVVNFTLSNSASAQEKLYVRYRTATNDFSTTGNLVQAAVSGTAATAIIPMVAAGTDVYYYIFSSTLTLSQLTALPAADIAYCNLKFADNSGSNYHYNATTCTAGTWRGTYSANWSDGANWCNGVPGTSANVVIPAGTAFSPATSTATAITVNSVTVNNNATFTLNTGVALTTGSFTNGGTINLLGPVTVNGNLTNNNSLSAGGGDISLTGNWTNNGSFSPGNGTVTFTNTAAQQGIGGTASTIFNNLVNNNTNAASVIMNAGVTVNNTLTLQTGSNLFINNQNLILKGTLTAAALGTLAGSSASTLTITDKGTSTATALGTLLFKPGFETLSALTLNRDMPANVYPSQTYYAATLGTPLTVASLTLTKGLLATGTNLLTLTSYGGLSNPALLNRLSYIVTNVPPASGASPFNGSYGFRINNISGATGDVYFPVGADFVSPSRMMINANAGAAARDITVVVTKGDIGNTSSPRVNRIWNVYPSVKGAINATMKLFYTQQNTGSFMTNQDELETGFIGTNVRLVQKQNLDSTVFINISNGGTDVQNNFATGAGNEAFAQYSPGNSTIYNGTSPGITSFNVFSIINGNNVVLPVTFISASALAQGSNIKVKWNVANEVNIDHYEVERAGANHSFTLLSSAAVLPNNGDGGVYIYTDEMPFAGNNFYRIKAVNKNNEYSNSDVVFANIAGNMKATIQVTPNPVVNRHFSLQLHNFTPGTCSVVVSDAQGKQVFCRQLPVTAAHSSHTIYLPAGIVEGLYFIQVTNNKQRISRPVLVAR